MNKHIITITKEAGNYKAEYDETKTLENGDKIVFNYDPGIFPDEFERGYILGMAQLDLEAASEARKQKLTERSQ